MENLYDIDLAVLFLELWRNFELHLHGVKLHDLIVEIASGFNMDFLIVSIIGTIKLNNSGEGIIWNVLSDVCWRLI